MKQYDIAIVGGGIVGLATAYHFALHYPDKSVAVLEKEHDVATHQTGRNSGVIHSGIYYRPGSLKAWNCREGNRKLVEFCEREGVPYDVCGKVIVAVDERERPRLRAIYERGIENGISCRIIGREELQELEPHAVGVEAIHVPDAGIVDFVGVCRRFVDVIRRHGHDLLLGACVHGMRRMNGLMTVESTAGEVHARYVVNCAGLYADHVARLSGDNPDVQVLPFRGEYYKLKPEAEHFCRNLIYPVPDPAFPFLGVHFTRMVGGGVECGPSAVLAFAREGYTLTEVNWKELGEILRYPGFRRLAAKHWKKGLSEIWQSMSKRAFLRQLQHLVPSITADDLEPAPSGVRAQAVTRLGQMVDDFLITETENVVNVCNAASPAATASLNVGKLVAETLAKRF